MDIKLDEKGWTSFNLPRIQYLWFHKKEEVSWLVECQPLNDLYLGVSWIVGRWGIHQLCNTLSTSLYYYLHSERTEMWGFFCVHENMLKNVLRVQCQKMWVGWHWTTMKQLPLFQYIHSNMKILVSWNICTSIRG